MAVKTYELIQMLGDMLDSAQGTPDKAEREDLLKAAEVIRHTILNGEGAPGPGADAPLAVPPRPPV
jgi:hypothetical protein